MPQSFGGLGNASQQQIRGKSGVTRIEANQIETDRRETKQNAEENARAVFESTARSNLDSVQKPARKEVQQRGNNSEIDDFQRTKPYSGAYFPNTVVTCD